VLNTRLRGHATSTPATTDAPTSASPAGPEHRSTDGGGDQSDASSSALPAGSAGGHSSPPPPPSGGGRGAGSTFFLRLREGFIRGSSSGQHVADTRFLPPFATVCVCACRVVSCRVVSLVV
jgi:hypothetical protein